MKDRIFKDYFINKEMIKDGNKCLIHAPRYWYPRYTLTKTIEPKELLIEGEFRDLEQHIVRGKDISPEIHEKLLDYKNILTKVFLEEIDLERLDSEIINDLNIAFGIEYINNKTIESKRNNSSFSRTGNIIIA